jgi:hypothetical protein
MALVGISKQLDAFDLLEKRIKSRFGGKGNIYFPYFSSFPVLQKMMTEWLTLDENGTYPSVRSRDSIVKWNEAAENAVKHKKPAAKLENRFNAGYDAHWFKLLCNIAVSTTTDPKEMGAYKIAPTYSKMFSAYSLLGENPRSARPHTRVCLCVCCVFVCVSSPSHLHTRYIG